MRLMGTLCRDRGGVRCVRGIGGVTCVGCDNRCFKILSRSIGAIGTNSGAMLGSCGAACLTSSVSEAKLSLGHQYADDCSSESR